MKETKETLGIGLIGCGSRLRHVAGKTCQQDPRLKITGLYDIKPQSIEKAKSCFSNLPDYAHAVEIPRVFDSPEALASDPGVDWVMVGSWNSEHRSHVEAAFNAGKHVFCEKPLATSLEDCVAMRDAWRKSDRQFAIGFTLRYSPHYRKIKELLGDGVVGDIISMEFNETLEFNHGGMIHDNWRSHTKHAGSHLLEKCSHDIDLANWMVGSRTSRVASFGGTNFFIPENVRHIKRLGRNPQGREAYLAWSHGTPGVNPFTREKDIVDNQVIIMEYENGVRATFHTNCNAGIPERRMYILGTEGAIRADVMSGTIQSKRIGFDTELKNHDTGASGGHGGGDGILAREIKDCMLNGDLPASGLEDGLVSAVTCFGIDQAHATGQVVDMKAYWEKLK